MVRNLEPKWILGSVSIGVYACVQFDKNVYTMCFICMNVFLFVKTPSSLRHGVDVLLADVIATCNVANSSISMKKKAHSYFLKHLTLTALAGLQLSQCPSVSLWTHESQRRT